MALRCQAVIVLPLPWLRPNIKIPAVVDSTAYSAVHSCAAPKTRPKMLSTFLRFRAMCLVFPRSALRPWRHGPLEN